MIPPPDDVTTLVEGALRARNAGKRLASLALFQAATRLQPNHPGLHLEAAFDHFNLGQLDQAEAEYRVALSLSPGALAAQLGLGHCARARGDHALALTEFGCALESHPGRAGTLLEMAAEWRALGQPAAAAARLAEAQANEPDHPDVLVQLAEQARLAHDSPRMLAAYEDGAARLPDHLGLQIGYADALALNGAVQQAITHLTDVEGRLGAGPALRVRQVALLRGAGFWRDALALARTATDAWPDDSALWLERLTCEETLGADADIDSCLHHAPARTAGEKARLARARARIQEDRGQIAAALVSYDEAHSLEPDVAETHFFRARLCLSRLMLAQARTALKGYVRAINPARPGNISQTHFGQILDELALDGAVLDALAAAEALTVPARIEAVLAVVRANHGNTAAALALMHAVSGFGLVGRQTFVPPEQAGTIPRRLVQFWDTADVPDDVAAMMESWPSHNPDYEVARFSTLTAEAFMEATFSRGVAAVFAGVGHPSQKADIFRLGYLAARGGIYVDADDRCHARLDRILPSTAALVLYQEDFGTLGNNFIAAAPNHPVILYAFRQALESAARGDAESIWLSTGPGLITRAVAQALTAAGPHWRRWFEANLILHRRDLFQASAIHCQAAYKLSGLHWGDRPQRPKSAI